MCCRKRFFLQCFSVHDTEVGLRVKKMKKKFKRSSTIHSTSRIAPNSATTTISIKEFDDVADFSLLPDFSFHHEYTEKEEVADTEHSLERLKFMLGRPYGLPEREEDTGHSLDRLRLMLAKPCRLEPIMEEEEELIH